MERPRQKMERWNKGDPLAAERFDNIAQAINTQIGGYDNPIQERGEPPASLGKQQFRVKSVEVDHLICRTFNSSTGQEGGGDIKVTLPYLLRRTKFEEDGRGDFTFVYVTNIERLATNILNERIKTEFIDPKYLLNDIIYGIRDWTGGLITIDNEILVWLDMNTDSREWKVESPDTFEWDVTNQGDWVTQGDFLDSDDFAFGVPVIGRLGTVAPGSMGHTAEKKFTGLIPEEIYKIDVWMNTDKQNTSPKNVLQVEIGDVDFTINQNLGVDVPKVIQGSVMADLNGEISFNLTGGDGAQGDGLFTSHCSLIKIIGTNE